MKIGSVVISLISEAIRLAIETKLNSNTAGETYYVGSYAYLEDTGEDYLYTVRNGYKLIDYNYIPCMMDFTVSYEPIPNAINGVAVVGLTFLLKSDTQAEFDEELEATEQLVALIVGNDDQIVDGSTTYNAVWNMDALVPAGETKPLNGTYYTQIRTTVYITFSDTFFMGNRYKYYLGTLSGETVTYTRFYPIDGDVTRANEEEYPHLLGDKEAKGGVKNSAWSASFTTNVNTFIETNIFNDTSSENYDLSKVFYYKETVNDVQTNAFKVHVKNIKHPVVLGDYQMISFDLFKSDAD